MMGWVARNTQFRPEAKAEFAAAADGLAAYAKVHGARACMQGPPKNEWDYLKPANGARVEREPDDDV